MKWTDEDVKLVEQFVEVKNRGCYVNGQTVTEVYNRVLEKSVASTSCGSCIRQRISELEVALNQFKEQMELSAMTATELTNEIQAIESEIEEENKPKRGRPRKE